MPKLVISLPDAGEVIHELTDSNLTIGRTEENTFAIDDVSVSTHHARLEAVGDGYLLTDLGSTNGTYVNGEKLEEPRLLQANDRVRFGKVDAIYEIPGQGGNQPLPEGQASTAAPASSSRRPGDFGNTSPFQQRKLKLKPMSVAATVLFLLAAAAFGAAAYFTTLLEAPKF